ncbi:hypothetical protein C8R43DRAFT_1010551 [Mycena crocata]|nr:hypothetical protein C8R43DRAFT_1010551 [Mycena crocata]
MSITTPHSAPRPHLLPDPAIKKQVRELLRRNVIEPPDHLPSTLAAIAEELAQYDDEIVELRAQLRSVEADREVLQQHYNDCHGLVAPVRRLLPEILVQIFELCRRVDWDVDKHGEGYPARRLAQPNLLRVAQVCSRWHNIGTGTSTLWNTIEVGHWIRSTIALPLVLERSGKAPLNVAIYYYRNEILKLIAQHSKRWITAKFVFPLADIDLQVFSEARAKLPVLETLNLQAFWAISKEAVDFFAIAPTLRNLTLTGSLISRVATPPLDQLHFLGYVRVRPEVIHICISRMAELSRGAEFRLELSLRFVNKDIYLDIPPTSSDIGRLSMDVAEWIQPEICAKFLGDIFASLTLPYLRDLSFEVGDWRCVLPWPHEEFLAASSRSSFHSHLSTLELYYTFITEEELLEVLHSLPSLKRLAISDQIVDREEKLLVTNNLMRNLTREADTPCLVPELVAFNCYSLLDFDHNLYLDFLVSRLHPEHPIESQLHYIDRGLYPWKLDPTVVARLDELCTKQRLVFSFAEAKHQGRWRSCSQWP